MMLLTEQAKQSIEEVDVYQVFKTLEESEPFYLIDVREQNEWNAGHLPKAVFSSKGLLEYRIERLVPELEAKIILYCGSGYRSALSVHTLKKMGYTQVASMQGGYHAWVNSGYPVIHPQSNPIKRWFKRLLGN